VPCTDWYERCMRQHACTNTRTHLNVLETQGEILVQTQTPTRCRTHAHTHANARASTLFFSCTHVHKQLHAHTPHLSALSQRAGRHDTLAPVGIGGSAKSVQSQWSTLVSCDSNTRARNTHRISHSAPRDSPRSEQSRGHGQAPC